MIAWFLAKNLPYYYQLNIVPKYFDSAPAGQSKHGVGCLNNLIHHDSARLTTFYIEAPKKVLNALWP
jgi:hypothetical protein